MDWLKALDEHWLTALGWLGNALYFGRFFVQWVVSERAKAIVAPTSFWWFSIGGALCLGAYSFLEGNEPFLIGYALTFVLYLRNLSIALLGDRAGSLGLMPALLLGGSLAFVLIRYAMPDAKEGMPLAWIVLAFVGQAIFSSRFIVQWLASERAGRAFFPPIFWWLSLVGNVLMLAYAIRLGNPVFIAGFALGPFIQIRNLMLGDPEPSPPASIDAAFKVDVHG